MNDHPSAGKLDRHVMQFARLLRAAGLPIGPGKVLLAVEALSVIDLRRREDVYWALHAVCVERHSQTELFELAFDRFWVVRPLVDDGGTNTFDDVVDRAPQTKQDELPRRLADALVDQGLANKVNEDAAPQEADDSHSWSATERLQSKDFESMSADELAQARNAMTQFTLPLPDLPSRRFKPHTSGRRIDMRATLRGTIRAGGSIDLKRKKRVRRHPPLVVLCDVSGSMEAYARMLLHFLHSVTNDQERVHTFVFGTRLTNITHHLRHADPDVALARIGATVTDWSGGTRIGETLASFNKHWSRRVLGQGAVVLLITDGLDRDGGIGLSEEMNRLQKSCRRLLWLNPLLRFEAFEPKSAGVKAMLPYVDEFRSGHNLDSLSSLAEALSDMKAPLRHHINAPLRDHNSAPLRDHNNAPLRDQHRDGSVAGYA